MKKHLFLLLFVTLSSSVLPTITFGKETTKTLEKKTIGEKNTEGERLPVIDTLPLKLEIISWVEASFRGGLLKRYKRDFERLIRLRLRKDLPMLSHEVKPINELRKELIEKGLIPDPSHEEFKKRGCVDCFVWTTGDNDLVVFLIECKLAGYGNYENPIHKEFESRILGYGSTLSARQQVEDSIRKIIARISAKFLGARDHLKGLSRKK